MTGPVQKGFRPSCGSRWPRSGGWAPPGTSESHAGTSGPAVSAGPAARLCPGGTVCRSGLGPAGGRPGARASGGSPERGRRVPGGGSWSGSRPDAFFWSPGV